MFIKTKHFGKIEIVKDNLINFKDGLLGFEYIKEYMIIHNEDEDVPFHWLQATKDGSLAFVVTNPYTFIEDYEFDIPKKVVEELDIKNHKDIMVLSITVVPDNITDMTINLRGPIIINMENKKGKQIVLNNDKYELKYKIFEKIKTSPMEEGDTC